MLYSVLIIHGTSCPSLAVSLGIMKVMHRCSVHNLRELRDGNLILSRGSASTIPLTTLSNQIDRVKAMQVCKLTVWLLSLIFFDIFDYSEINRWNPNSIQAKGNRKDDERGEGC